MRQGRALFKFALLVSLTMIQVGCASWGQNLKAFLGGKSTSSQAMAAKPSHVKFSDNANVYSGARRQYKRVTRETMAADSALEPQAGSLWVMEGQGAYLFSQNIMRMVGDPIAVTLEGEPREQLQAKVDVIRRLLTKYEERQARLRAPAAEGNKEGKDAKGGEKASGDNRNTTQANKDAQESADKASGGAAGAPSPGDMAVRNVPTRIVERTVDGNYRVKGSQPFMIGSREYKVIVTGVVKAEDFNDEGISASRLLDAKYDVVSARRKEQEL